MPRIKIQAMTVLSDKRYPSRADSTINFYRGSSLFNTWDLTLATQRLILICYGLYYMAGAISLQLPVIFTPITPSAA